MNETPAMTPPDSAKWAPMAAAPRDGTLVIVRVRASEQGPSEVDTVRWSRSARSGEEGWVANDSDPFARVIYAEGELAGWRPLPSQRPGASAPPVTREKPSPPTDETDGGGI